MGKGVVDADDPHALFTAGLRAQDYPAGFMGQADLVVCVGYDLVEWSPVAWNPRRDRRIICIDTVAAEIDEHYVPDVELTGDIAHILTHLGNLVSEKPPARLAAPPYRELLRAGARPGLRRRLPGQAAARPARPARADGARRRAHLRRRRAQALDLAPVADPQAEHRADLKRRRGDGLRRAGGGRRRLVLPRDRRVVTISGDGGFLMNFQELETAKRLGLAIVNIVWTDSAYGVIEMHQNRKFGRLAGTKFENPDLVALAESFGLAGLRVESADEVTPTLREALALDVSSVVEIPIDYRENVRFSQRLADFGKVEEGVV